MLTPSRLHELMTEFINKRLLVIGDLMLDEFIWGRVSRISPEAPVPVVEVDRLSSYPGGAANVARNLCEFTSQVAVMGVIGDCGQAHQLKALLHKHAICLDFVQQLEEWQTIVKTRVIARQQHVVRVDRERRESPELLEKVRAKAIEQLKATIHQFDAIIIEDYGKGLLNQEFVDAIIAVTRAAGKIVTVDPNIHNVLQWEGVTAIKPNRSEAFFAAGVTGWDAKAPSTIEPAKDPILLKVGNTLLERWKPQSLLITLGDQGMLLFEPEKPAILLPTRAREVFDLSGAGDTSIALFTLSLAAGATPHEAAQIANHAAGVVVSKLGTATLTLQELLASFGN